jgi:hypothetical protein
VLVVPLIPSLRVSAVLKGMVVCCAVCCMWWGWWHWRAKEKYNFDWSVWRIAYFVTRVGNNMIKAYLLIKARAVNRDAEVAEEVLWSLRASALDEGFTALPNHCSRLHVNETCCDGAIALMNTCR